MPRLLAVESQFFENVRGVPGASGRGEGGGDALGTRAPLDRATDGSSQPIRRQLPDREANARARDLERRATSGWSRPKGTATTGTAWASAFCVIPIPA